MQLTYNVSSAIIKTNSGITMQKTDKRTTQPLTVQKNYYQSKAITHTMHWISRNINSTLTDLTAMPVYIQQLMGIKS